MNSTTLTRPQRAMQIERRTFRQWTAGPSGLNIPSQTVANRTYSATTDSCSCPDHFYRHVACKHMLAARIFVGRNS